MSAREYSPVQATSVKQSNGSPALFIQYQDGSESVMKDLSFKDYSYISARTDYIEQMADNDLRTFNFVLALADSITGFSDPIWTGYDEDGNKTYNFAPIVERMDRTLAACPNAKVIVQMVTGAPVAWLEANRDEVAVRTVNAQTGETSWFYEGSVSANANQYYPSIYAPLYRQQAGEAVQDIVRFCEEKYGGHIIVYCTNGMSTEEWYHHGWHNLYQDDYSPAAAAAFQAWAQAKYGTEAALQAAWSKPAGFTFADVAIPLPPERFANPEGGAYPAETFYDVSTSMNVVDFQQFYNEVIADTISFFASQVKAVAPGKCTMAIYAYEYEFGGDVGSGSIALHKLLESEALDIVGVTWSYANRYPGTGGDGLRSPLLSAKLHGKLVFYDNDVVTSELPNTDAYYTYTPEQLAPVIANFTETNAYSPSPEVGANVLSRAMGFAAVNNFMTNYFDLAGGYYNNQTILDRTRLLDEAYFHSFDLDRQSAAQVLMVTDEVSCGYPRQSTLNGSLFLHDEMYNIMRSLIKLGASYDAVFVDDLPLLDVSQYKLVIVNVAYNLTTAQRGYFDALKGGGRTVLWAYAPGLFNGSSRSDTYMQQLTGIALQSGANGALGMSIAETGANALALAIRAEMGAAAGQPLQIDAAGTANLVYVAPGALQTVATLPGDAAKATMSYLQTGTGEQAWTSLYCAFANLPTGALRAIAAWAGVHLYTEKRSGAAEAQQYDTAVCNGSLLSVHANGDGARTIRLPEACDVYDFITGEQLFANTAELTFTMTDTQQQLLRLEQPGFQRPLTPYEVPPRGLVTPPTGAVHSGARALKITKQATWAKAHYSYFSLREGYTYILRFWARCPDALQRSDIRMSSALTWSTPEGAPDLSKPPIDLVGENLYYVQPSWDLSFAPLRVEQDGWIQYTAAYYVLPEDLSGGSTGVRHPGTSPAYSMFIYTTVDGEVTDAPFYIDDVSFVEVDPVTFAEGPNMVVNGGFEDAAPELGTHWSSAVGVALEVIEG